MQFIEDLCFYFCHKALHSRYLYSLIHKVHHEVKEPYSLAVIHVHPVEYIIGNALPMMIGPVILYHRIHRASVFGWYFVRIAEGIDGHCGYSFPWSPFRLLPCQPEESYHHFHHVQNVGNYCSLFTLWDCIFGTNTAFHKNK